MREFGITFDKEFRKGLRAFRNPPRGEEGLVECYNLMPGEIGLLPHEPLTDIDLTDLTGSIPPELVGLRAYWKLNETIGPYLDVLGNVPLTNITDAAETDLEAVVGIISNGQKAIQLNAGQGTRAEGASGIDHANLKLAAVSWHINFWFRYPETSGFSYWILRKFNDTNLREWGIEIQGTSVGSWAIVFYRGDGGNNWSHNFIRVMTARVNVWHMIGISYAISTGTLTVRISNPTDGFEAFASSSVGFPVLVNTVSPIVLANFMQTSELTKEFTYDEIGIWGRELTLTERTRLWNSGNGRTYPFV